MQQLRFRISFLSLVIAFFAVGCVPLQPRVIYNPSNPIRTVAVLPVLNHTNDVEAPERVRQEFEKRLARMGYKSKPLAEVNKILKDELGITLGKQLDLTNPVELGQKLGVDAVIYGTLFDFNEKTTGILDIRRVKMGFRMVTARDLTSENLSAFANFKEALDKSYIGVLKIAIEAINSEEKAGKMTKVQADNAREDLKKAYNITHLDISRITVPQTKWGTAGTTFWAAGGAIKGTTKIKGGLAGAVASGAAMVSGLHDLGDLKNAKQMSEYPGVERWIELPPVERDAGLGASMAMSLGTKVLGQAMGTKLKTEMERAITEIYHTIPVGRGDGMAAPVVPEVKASEPKAAQKEEHGLLYLGWYKQKKDLSATLCVTILDKSGKEIGYREGLFGMKGGKMSEHPTEIRRGNTNIVTIASISSTTPDDRKLVKTKVGDEVVDGHPTEKYSVKDNSKDGILTGAIWYATDLDGLAIKSEVEDKNFDFKVITKLNNIVIGPPDPNVFKYLY